VEGLYDLYEIVMVDATNQRRIAAAYSARAKAEAH
jgi:hypothetical protein